MAEDRPDRIGHLAEFVTRGRHDPMRLAALRRSMTGMTRCPQCDALNRADQRLCDKCGAKLYPELREKEEKNEEDDETQLMEGTHR